MNAVKNFFRASAEDFKKIPGSPVAYWVTSTIFEVFNNATISSIGATSKGIITGDNSRFLRCWYEVGRSDTNYQAEDFKDAIYSDKKWYPCRKGGSARRWYGNGSYVIDWKNNGFNVIKMAESENRNCQDYADRFHCYPIGEIESFL
jgi:hypothetical protein